MTSHVAHHVAAVPLDRGNGCRDGVEQGGVLGKTAEAQEWCIDGRVELEGMWRG